MYKMKTGNAILVAFFIWLAVDLPVRIFTISETYFVGEFVGMGRDEWMVFSFVLPFFFAILFGIYGVEKKKKDMYYKKGDEKQDAPVQKKEDAAPAAPAVQEPGPAVVEDPGKQLKEIIDVGEQVDKIAEMKEKEKREKERK